MPSAMVDALSEVGLQAVMQVPHLRLPACDLKGSGPCWVTVSASCCGRLPEGVTLLIYVYAQSTNPQ